jgi:hypothetical protein
VVCHDVVQALEARHAHAVAHRQHLQAVGALDRVLDAEAGQGRGLACERQGQAVRVGSSRGSV